ncbi:hypothetical protein D3C76_1838170 [compost metagenome]
MPACRALATRSAASISRLTTLATRPNSLSLARSMASASLAKLRTQSTGPKISSFHRALSFGTSVNTVGWRK